MNFSVSRVKDAGTDALAIVAGLVAAKFAMDFAQDKLPNANLTPLAGLIGLAPYVTNVGGSLGKSVGAGIMAAGIIQAAKNFTADKTGILATVNQALPALSGFGGFAGFGSLSNNPDFNLLNGVMPEVASERVLLM